MKSDWQNSILPFFTWPRIGVALALAALSAGAAMNWGWLTAMGAAPLLLTALPCLVMCGLGLCMSKMQGQACKTERPTPHVVSRIKD